MQTTDQTYYMEASLSFTRRDGEERVSHTIELGDNANDMYRLLPKVLEFMQSLGFRWVHGVAILNEDGSINMQSFNPYEEPTKA